MKDYLVRYLKGGELYQCIVRANDSIEARSFTAIKESIPLNLEINGDYYNTYVENNHVSSVVEL